MADRDELELGVLDRSVESYQTARDNFWRDLKIVWIGLLAFQFLVFFRFASLMARKADAEGKLDHGTNTLISLTNAAYQLVSLNATLDQNQKAFADQIRTLPHTIRQGLTNLNQEYLAAKKQPTETRPSPLFEQQTPVTPQFSHLNILKPVERERLLRNPDDKIVERLVHETVVVPAFSSLSNQWQQLIVRPSTETVQALSSITNSFAGATDTNLGKLVLAVDRTRSDLATNTFSPPGQRGWWKSAATKTEMAGRIVDEASGSVNAATNVLVSAVTSLKTHERTLAHALQAVESARNQVEEKLRALEANAVEFKGLLENFTTPIPYVTIKLQEAIAWFPTVLALAFCASVLRYLFLRDRASALIHKYEQLGLSQQTLNLGFYDQRLRNGSAAWFAFVGLFLAVLTTIDIAMLLRHHTTWNIEVVRSALWISGLAVLAACIWFFRAL
jgi:hypothetical protein